MFKRTRKAAAWWMHGWTRPLRETWHPTEERDVTSPVRAWYRGFTTALRGLWAMRNAKPGPALTYDSMLQAWGLRPEDVPKVVRRLRRVRWRVYAIAIVCWLFAGLQFFLPHNGSVLIVLINVFAGTIAGCIGIVMEWRLDCLLTGRYIRLRQWLGLPHR